MEEAHLLRLGDEIGAKIEEHDEEEEEEASMVLRPLIEAAKRRSCDAGGRTAAIIAGDSAKPLVISEDTSLRNVSPVDGESESESL